MQTCCTIENHSKLLIYTGKPSKIDKIRIFSELRGLFRHKRKVLFQTVFYRFVEDKKLYNICEIQSEPAVNEWIDS